MNEARNPDKIFVRHVPCPECGSSDAGALYRSGRVFCYVCQKNVTSENRDDPPPKPAHPQMSAVYTALPDRGITADTCKHWHYRVADNGVHLADYLNDEGNVIATKVRNPDKTFAFSGRPAEVGLYGQWLWKPHPNKRIVVTEGEIDALSVSQLQKNEWPTVSVPNGAQSALRACQKAYDYLNGFKHIVLMFDMDEPGREAAEKVAQLFDPGKVSVAELPFKDANECLVKGAGNKVIEQVFHAKVWRPDGIIDAADMWERLQSVETAKQYAYPWPAWNTFLGGLRAGEIVMLTAGSGIGKSSVAREIGYHLVSQGLRVGMIMLEETPEETALELMSLHAGKRIRLADRVHITAEERKAAFDATCGTGRYIMYDTKGMFDVDNILQRASYMRKALECDFIIIDNITISVAGIAADADERRTIDRFMSRLRQLAVATGVGLIVVSHLRRPPNGEAHEEGARVTLSQLRGSGNIVNFSNVIVGLERDQQGADRNKAIPRALKSRLYAATGAMSPIYFDPETGRLTERTAFTEEAEHVEVPF